MEGKRKGRRGREEWRRIGGGQEIEDEDGGGCGTGEKLMKFL